jgi:hypothetical protein
MLLLPKTPMKARLMDARVAFLVKAKQIMVPMPKKLRYGLHPPLEAGA